MFLAPRLGHDFSSVRIHSDPEAAAAAHAEKAQAYTVGDHVAFGSGRYAPSTTAGRWLLAHELTHVIQQHNPPSPVHEAEAEARQAATEVSLGRTTRITRGIARGSLHRFGEPENIPDLTYITTQGGQEFLNQATAYHTSWGLNPIRITSVEAVVDHLAAQAASNPLGRVRIVMHAADVGVYSSLFAGDPLLSLEGDRLRAWAESDVAGLRHDLGPTFQVPEDVVDALMTLIRDSPAGAALLRPFGLDQAGMPTGALHDLVAQTAQRGLIESSRTSANAASIDTVLTTVDTLLADARARTQIQGNLTAAQATDLQEAVRAAGRSTGLKVTSPWAPDADTVSRLRRANRAVAGGFRGKLDRARQRFDTASWIDIRGCRAAENLDYLHAVARFFGAPAALPHVSGPDWYQSFPTLAWRQFPDLPSIEGLVSDADVATALDLWAPMTGVRGLLAEWRAYYESEVARQRRLSAEPSPPSRFGVDTLQLQAPPTLPPLSGGLTNPPAETFTANLLFSRPLQLRNPAASPSAPGIVGGRPAAPRLAFTDPWVTLAENALARLVEPAAELRFYFMADLVLPVRSATNPQDVQLYLFAPRLRQAIANWLGSQWRTRAPGLEALQSGKWRAEQRRVQALVESHAPDAMMVFPPDPAYFAHIKAT